MNIFSVSHAQANTWVEKCREKKLNFIDMNSNKWTFARWIFDMDSAFELPLIVNPYMVNSKTRKKLFLLFLRVKTEDKKSHMIFPTPTIRRVRNDFNIPLKCAFVPWLDRTVKHIFNVKWLKSREMPQVIWEKRSD